MKILPLEFKRSDKRGSLIQVISSPGWQQLNHLKINKDNTFGGHYHKERTELFYIISGQVELKIENVQNNITSVLYLKPNKEEVVIIEPYERHTIIALENSEIIELLNQPFTEEDNFCE